MRRLTLWLGCMFLRGVWCALSRYLYWIVVSVSLPVCLCEYQDAILLVLTEFVCIDDSFQHDSEIRLQMNMSHVTRKPVVGVCDQVRHKPVWSATETSYRLEISAIACRVSHYPGSEQQRRWSDCADVQADLHLCCSHMTWMGFLMTWLIWWLLLNVLQCWLLWCCLWICSYFCLDHKHYRIEESLLVVRCRLKITSRGYLFGITSEQLFRMRKYSICIEQPLWILFSCILFSWQLHLSLNEHYFISFSLKYLHLRSRNFGFGSCLWHWHVGWKWRQKLMS